MKKLVFNFKSKITKKFKYPKNILGGKGANLAEMGRLGFPVPSGFTISTNACEAFYKNNKKLDKKVLIEIKKELSQIEKEIGKKLAILSILFYYLLDLVREYQCLV